MGKSLTLEDRLAKLDALRDEPASSETAAALKHALGLKNSLVIAKAAELVGEWSMRALTDELLAAFARLIDAGFDADKGCRAKVALVEAMRRVECLDDAAYLRGVSHRQMEPVWGGRADTAAGLRGVCAFGLVEMNHPRVLLMLADLLADPESPARIDAARAIGHRGATDGLPPLRLRVRVGDNEPNVLTECLLAMLTIDAAGSLAFVLEQLRGEDPLRAESAALALGQSRLVEAFVPLREWWLPLRGRELRQTAMLAMAMLRRDEATAFLLAQIETGRTDDASDAIEALRHYRHDASLAESVIEAAQRHEDREVSERARSAFA